MGNGCGPLQMISLANCDGITDISISALGHRRGHLHMVDVRGCEGITSIGISALRVRCSVLLSDLSIYI
jgi:hypothetical protein